MRASICLIALSTLAFGHEVDWEMTFNALTSHDRSVSDPARDEVFNTIVPRLLEQDAALTSAEIPGILVQFNRKEDDVRLQASGLLFVIASNRPDSETILAGAIPNLVTHLNDAVPRIQANAVAILSSLNPDMPDDAVRALIDVLDGPNDGLAPAAARGLARVSSTKPIAEEALQRALSETHVSRRAAVIGGIAAARTTDPVLIARLGALLADKDPAVVHASLLAISDLGIGAIPISL